MIEAIKARFNSTGRQLDIPALQDGKLDVELLENGVVVHKIDQEFKIPWDEFLEVVNVTAKGPHEAGFYITTIKGAPTYVVYGAQLNRPVYDKIAQLIAILIWSGICRLESGFLILNV